jgi:hypothetical protein
MTLFFMSSLSAEPSAHYPEKKEFISLAVQEEANISRLCQSKHPHWERWDKGRFLKCALSPFKE